MSTSTHTILSSRQQNPEPITIHLSNRLPKDVILHIQLQLQRYTRLESSQQHSSSALTILQKSMLADIEIPTLGVQIYIDPERELLHSLRDDCIGEMQQRGVVYALVEFQEKVVLQMREYVFECLNKLRSTGRRIQLIPYLSGENLKDVLEQLLMCSQRLDSVVGANDQGSKSGACARVPHQERERQVLVYDHNLNALVKSSSLDLAEFLKQRSWSQRMFAQCLRDRDPLLMHDLGEDMFWELHAQWFGDDAGGNGAGNMLQQQEGMVQVDQVQEHNCHYHQHH